jgi:hypothetical protein
VRCSGGRGGRRNRQLALARRRRERNAVRELVDDNEIAGCVKSADQRVVNPSAW